MNLTDTNYHWKNKMDWIFDTWWDKILQPQKWTFWERDSKKLNNITVLHFMTTFHNTALKIETSFKLQRCLSPFWKLEKSMKKVKTYWNMLKMQDNHHFRLNIATDKSTSLDLRKMGLYFKTLSSCKTAFYGWIRLCLQFLKKLKLHTKLVPETVHWVKPCYFFGRRERQWKKWGQ